VADVVPLPVVLRPRWTQQVWMSRAACKGQTHHFFAPHGEQAEARERREAVAAAICRTCPVLLECRDYARRHREQGWWGGENDEDRLEARRRARRTARPPSLGSVAG
jgi:WhiB family redox-sensing transcriptional regulator